jgi:HIV Tat-specific factor 1
MNGRNFDGRRVIAELYDGTKYDRSGRNDANSDDEEERLKQYEHWLENNNE